MTTPQGIRLGPYTLLEPLGAGGMGEVHRAHDPRLDREVAIKVIRSADVPQDEAIDRLLTEATLASALNHPNIVTIYETGSAGGDRYIAMELVQGATLRALGSQGLSLDRAIEIARQVAEALAVAHRANIIHRDIKPENIMVRPDGYVKVLDFGLARLQPAAMGDSATGTRTAAGLIVGTVGYMSPEQARSEPATAASDIFSLGIVLYELMTGRHPFAAPSPLGTLHALMWETPEPPCLLNPELPRPVEQLVLEALHKDPRLRPGAEEVLYRLTMARDASVALALSSVSVSARSVSAAARQIVGRELELDALLHELDRALRGRGRVVAISAEAGMGKTTLVETFLRHLEDADEPVRIARGRCSERLAGSEAYLPVIEALDSLQRDGGQHGNLSRLMRTLAPTWYGQIGSSPDHDTVRRAADDGSGASQERLKRELLALLDEICRVNPVVFCIDDLHWADPSTIELIAYLARRLDTMRLMIVVTARPSELAQARHPFLPLKLDLIAHGLCREITPSVLDENAIDRYIALQYPDHAFPPGFAALIHQRTAGHPLFVADLLRDLRRQQVLREENGRWRLAEDMSTVAQSLPESVRSLLRRKIDALDEEDRRLLSAASVQGVDFDSAVVAAALRADDEDVERRLERLEREHALVRFTGEFEYPDRSLTLRYVFAHNMYHHGFYDAVRATRRAALSGAVAACLVSKFGAQASAHANDLARLFESARDPARAAEYFAIAADSALHLYAHDEAAQLASRGLTLLRTLPDAPSRAVLELPLQMTYGLAMKTGRGYAVPEVGAAYARARELCRQIDDPRRVVPVLVGLTAHHIVAGEIGTSRDVALEVVALGDRLGDPHLQMLGQWSLGAALFHLGELEVSHVHLSRGIELYDPAFHRPRVWETGIEPGIFCRCELSRTLMLRGDVDQALDCIRIAVAQAREIDHPQPLAFALLFEIFVHLGRRQPADVVRVYDQLAEVCRAHDIAQELQWAVPLRGRALIELGDAELGLRELEDGLEAHTITRSALLRPYYFVLYAGALLRVGRLDASQRALDEARAIADDTHQVAYDAEYYRLQGELFSRAGRMAEAEAAYQRAGSIAREQGARWFELRAARAYAHFLLHTTDRTTDAHTILSAVLDRITEGRDTPDVQFADTLLRTLA
ncbi:MAG TPA: protein kinase [Vicinamibacterales bacterium]|nr:protein kinase [Vicinamibacterales bacterium]